MDILSSAVADHHLELSPFEIGKIIEVGCVWSIDCRCLKIFSFREEYELTDDHFCLVELGSIILIDDACLESPFDIDEFSLDEELFRPISERSPHDTVRVFSF